MDFLFKKASTDNSPSETPPQGDSFSFKFSSGGNETGNVFSFLDRGNSSPPTQGSSSNNNGGGFSFLFKDSAQPSTTFTPNQSDSSLNTSGSFPFQTESPPNKNNNRVGSSTSQPSTQSSLFGVSLTPAKRPSNDMDTSSDQQPINPREQLATVERELNNSLLKSPPSLQPPLKKIKQSSAQPESVVNKENVRPLNGDENGNQSSGSSLPFSPKKFSLSATASPIKAPSPQKPSTVEFSTPKKPLQPLNKMTPPQSFSLMKSPGTPSMLHTPTKPIPSTTHVNTPRPPINSNPTHSIQRQEEDNLQQSFEKTEKFISKHRTDLDEMKDVEQQLEGVKRKDTELSKTMEEINNKMNDYSDTLKTLTLKVTLLTNKMLMSQCPIINEKVEQIHSKYAHLINKTL